MMLVNTSRSEAEALAAEALASAKNLQDIARSIRFATIYTVIPEQWTAARIGLAIARAESRYYRRQNHASFTIPASFPACPVCGLPLSQYALLSQPCPDCLRAATYEAAYQEQRAALAV